MFGLFFICFFSSGYELAYVLEDLSVFMACVAFCPADDSALVSCDVWELASIVD